MHTMHTNRMMTIQKTFTRSRTTRPWRLSRHRDYHLSSTYRIHTRTRSATTAADAVTERSSAHPHQPHPMQAQLASVKTDGVPADGAVPMPEHVEERPRAAHRAGAVMLATSKGARGLAAAATAQPEEGDEVMSRAGG
mmetsp:Transcript_61196/g.126376  ORF Transcript_61196/g.126376 Transcript_61196/m.126376 type:complete len:138 (+) Transcript_61196:4516-4929(+)